jgi:2-polyprenyl-3-methyl-5-hydroxy-6-metoxy-1,4-benzoquinol methylase/uncharacterized protein YbaR (Trm112 family)
MNSVDPWYLENIVCPIDWSRLRFDGQKLISEDGRCYPVVEGVPVLLIDDDKQTIGLARASIERAQGRSEIVDQRASQLYLESLGLSDDEKAEVARLWKGKLTAIDPVVAMIIGATCGNAYKGSARKLGLNEYPIPSISLTPAAVGDLLLDIGCSWGRWSIAAARKGFSTVGIDPSLSAIMAAKRIANELKLDVKYIVADARYLPFRNERFSCVYSYSVLQHFGKEDARRTLMEVGRVLKPGGLAKIQMANKFGIRSIQQQLSRRSRQPEVFEVRYWTIAELRSTFLQIIGETRISADCYFGLGWQWSDFRYMAQMYKLALIASELLRRLSGVVAPMCWMADSVFCTAVKSSAIGAKADSQARAVLGPGLETPG